MIKKHKILKITYQKQTGKSLTHSLQDRFEKRKRFLSRLQRISENIDTLTQSRLNVKELDPYDDLLKLFLDAHYEYFSKFYFEQVENGN